MAIFGFLVILAVLTLDDDMSRPISDRDGIIIAMGCTFTNRPNCEHLDCEVQVRAGEEIFGYAAPLENFIRLFPVTSSGGDAVGSWADKGGIATYILPLFDEDGNFVTSFYISRVESDAFSASQNRVRHAEYFEAKNHIKEVHNFAGGGFKILQGSQAHIIYVEADIGVVGKICWHSQGSIENIKGTESFTGRILTEKDIVQLLRELSR